MGLEKICVSKETAIRLFEAGVVIEYPIAMWVSDDNMQWQCVFTEGYNWSDFPCYSGFKYQYPAPSGDEIEKFITKDYTDRDVYFVCEFLNNRIRIDCGVDNLFYYQNKQSYDNKADAMAEIAFWFVELQLHLNGLSFKKNGHDPQ